MAAGAHRVLRLQGCKLAVEGRHLALHLLQLDVGIRQFGVGCGSGRAAARVWCSKAWRWQAGSPVGMQGPTHPLQDRTEAKVSLCQIRPAAGGALHAAAWTATRRYESLTPLGSRSLQSVNTPVAQASTQRAAGLGWLVSGQAQIKQPVTLRGVLALQDFAVDDMLHIASAWWWRQQGALSWQGG